MTDYEANTIKPVKSLQTVAGLAPAKRREERRRRRQLHAEQDESTQAETPLPQEQPKNEEDRGNDGIDYCA
jgi:hypothetical protein